jgi:hypothetical protein
MTIKNKMNQWFIPLSYFRRLLNADNCRGADQSAILSRYDNRAILVSTFGLNSSKIGKLIIPVVPGQFKVYVTEFDINLLRDFIKGDIMDISLEKIFHFKHNEDGSIQYPIRIMCNLGNVIMPSCCEYLDRYMSGMYINDTIYSAFLSELDLDDSGILKYMTNFKTTITGLFGDSIPDADDRIAVFEKCLLDDMLICDHGFNVTGNGATPFHRNHVDVEIGMNNVTDTVDNVVADVRNVRFLDSDSDVEFE